jgi:hypothetical protein
VLVSLHNTSRLRQGIVDAAGHLGACMWSDQKSSKRYGQFVLSNTTCSYMDLNLQT